MFNHFTKTAFCCITLLSSASIQAQEVNFDNVYFKYDIAPTMPDLQSYKTFDLTFSNNMESLFKKEKEGNLDFKPQLSRIDQVANSEELHVFCTLYSLKMTKNAEKKDAYNIDLHTVVTNKYGTMVYENRYNYDEVTYVPRVENNKYSMKYYCIEQAIQNSLGGFMQNVHGYTADGESKLAKLDDVKKKSELYGFVEQVKLLSSEISKGIPQFVTAAEKYVPFWEKMTQYSEGKRADDVKRAAYQNLSVYYIMSKNNEKFQATLAEYKKIDKEVKALFGLVKYKNSEDCEKLLALLTPKPIVVIDEKKASAVVLSKEKIQEVLMYNTIEGTVRIKDKKIGGTYKGLVKVRNMITTGRSSNVLNLDVTDIEVLIVGKNEKDEPVTINTSVSKIEELIATDGKKYIAQKFSNAIAFAASGNAGYYALLNISYESPKVTVYRCVIPTSYSSDYVVRKVGDEKGIRSGGLFDSKKVIDYFSDCPAFKAGQVDKKAALEALAEQYSNCK